MYNYYKDTAINAISKYGPTEEEIEAIYRHKQMEYRMEDVKAHAEDMREDEILTDFELELVSNNAELLAERYIYKYQDCSLAENDVMRSMILDYVLDEKNNSAIAEEED